MAEQRRTSRTPKGKTPQPVNDYGRIQPQAPELEEAVLGALMIEKDAYSLVSEILRPNHSMSTGINCYTLQLLIWPSIRSRWISLP